MEQVLDNDNDNDAKSATHDKFHEPHQAGKRLEAMNAGATTKVGNVDEAITFYYPLLG